MKEQATKQRLSNGDVFDHRGKLFRFEVRQDRWEWVYVRVVMIKQDDEAEGGQFDTKYTASLGGMESDCEEYLSETGYELADEILSEWKKS